MLAFISINCKFTSIKVTNMIEVSPPLPPSFEGAFKICSLKCNVHLNHGTIVSNNQHPHNRILIYIMRKGLLDYLNILHTLGLLEMQVRHLRRIFGWFFNVSFHQKSLFNICMNIHGTSIRKMFNLEHSTRNYNSILHKKTRKIAFN